MFVEAVTDGKEKKLRRTRSNEFIHCTNRKVQPSILDISGNCFSQSFWNFSRNENVGIGTMNINVERRKAGRAV